MCILLPGGTQLKSTGAKAMEVKVAAEAASAEPTPMSDDEGRQQTKISCFVICCNHNLLVTLNQGIGARSRLEMRWLQQ